MNQEKLKDKLNAIYIELDNLTDELKSIYKLIDNQKDQVGRLVQDIKDGELDE